MSGFHIFPDLLRLPRFIPIVAVMGTDGQGASIPIRGVCLHGVGRSAAAVASHLIRELADVDRLLEVTGEPGGEEPVGVAFEPQRA